MAKLAIFAFLFVALFALSSATSHTTVVTTVVDEEQNPSCDQELQSMPMEQCRTWMMQSMMGQGQGGWEIKEVNQMQDPMMMQCCSELKSVSRPCRCEAIRKMMMSMQQQPMMSGKMEDMWQMAKSLPQMCMMKSPTHCSMRAVFF